MSLHVKNERTLKEYKKNSLGQQAETFFGKDLAETFKAMKKDIDRLKKRLDKLEKTEDKQSQKAYAMASENQRRIAAVVEQMQKAGIWQG